VVTTFFQIFHAFFGKENRRLIKFPNIRNAIFLLDEIQSTPYKYRKNFSTMFELLAREYNCYFVLSSATLPLIFAP
jgi:CRISPR-associated endonuclease/helicase Cas3